VNYNLNFSKFLKFVKICFVYILVARIFDIPENSWINFFKVYNSNSQSMQLSVAGLKCHKGTRFDAEYATGHCVCTFQVAIKIIDTRKIKDEYVRANLHREARIMASLRHPNIIRLYETLKVRTIHVTEAFSCIINKSCYDLIGRVAAYLPEQNVRFTAYPCYLAETTWLCMPASL